MTAVELIYRKRQGERLSAPEIEFLVTNYVKGEIPDYQMSAFMMAVYFQGLGAEELGALTRAMMNSGESYDWSGIAGPKVDKHSTGGVGDKVSLILAPLAAACGLVVPMVAGRGLGHTGGTLDKLESIPGFKVNLSKQTIAKILKNVGAVIVGQSERFVPADKKLYALRDVTATVESIPLIAASIMSKKLAEGCEGLVLDIKVGNGAFMKEAGDARILAQTMIGLGRELGRDVSALLTNMDQPTGSAVGNASEVTESIECLRGKWPKDLKRITYALTAKMLELGGICRSEKLAVELMERKIASGDALKVFQKMVEAQGGDPSVVDEPQRLKLAPKTQVVAAPQEGFIAGFDTRGIGLAASVLGAGRKTKDDSIDPGVGIFVEAKIGDRVEKGQPVFTARYRHDTKWRDCALRLQQAFTISRNKVDAPPLIIETINA